MATEPKISGIYKIVNTVNGKKYVGSAVDIMKRWNEHRRNLRQNKHHSKKLQNAWNKYGEKVFEFSVIEECERARNVLLVREQYWMDTLNVHGPTGYNICPVAGNAMGRKHTEKTKIKMSKAAKNRPPISDETRRRQSESAKNKEPPSMETRKRLGEANFGHTVSDETRAKQSIAARNRSPETKAKMSESARNRKPVCDETRSKQSESAKNRPPASKETLKKMSISQKGKTHSEETKTKLRAFHLGKPKSPESEAARIKSRALKRAERLTQLPIVLAKIILLAMI